ncbi:MAG TPA: hypothetical protein VNW53_15710 [Phenylobacterium sp.]|jgi:hypothetical protein|uniref:hypothetical protein n=1 Tax=Phenylobacterium sp. TaxID=1871053 RepID=UPI002C71ADDB|nr:hypothetical protein [Phenylobacterium sp.]HXA40444.1 hypothetical protein [Phenylobacterium sp.]
MVMQATPETAYLTQVRLGQLRWTAAILGPRTHGRLKPTEPPEPPQVTTICYRHFEIEVEPGTGRRRVIAWTPDSDTLKPVREAEGLWTGPVDPVAKAAAIQRLADERGAPESPAGPPPDDPEGWC